MIHNVMRFDVLGRAGLAGYLLDVTRSTVAFSATYAAAVVAPIVLGGPAGPAVAGGVTAAALVVAVPGYLTWCGLPTAGSERARAAGWVVLVAALVAVAAINTAASAAVVSMLANDGLLLAVGLAFIRALRWIDVRALGAASRRAGRN